VPLPRPSGPRPEGGGGGGLRQQGAVREAAWPGIKAGGRANPQRVNEMLWANPRTVFFREEPLGDLDAAFGPRGAQGVPLTPGRSIAVDTDSIPYGTPGWLASAGPQVIQQPLVSAPDPGTAVAGARRGGPCLGRGSAAGGRPGRPR